MADPEHGESETPAEPGAAKEQPHGMGRRIVGWVMLAAGVLILGSTAWVGWRTDQAYSHLQNAATDVSRLQDDVRNVAAIDQTATAATIEHVQAESAARGRPSTTRSFARPPPCRGSGRTWKRSGR